NQSQDAVVSANVGAEGVMPEPGFPRTPTLPAGRGWECGVTLFHQPADGRDRTASGDELAIARLLLQAPVIQEHAPAEEGHPRPAMHLPSFKQRITRLAEVISGLDGPVRRWVDNEQVGIRPDANGALARIQSENSSRVLSERTRHPPDGQATLDYTFAVHERHEGLDAW